MEEQNNIPEIGPAPYESPAPDRRWRSDEERRETQSRRAREYEHRQKSLRDTTKLEEYAGELIGQDRSFHMAPQVRGIDKALGQGADPMGLDSAQRPKKQGKGRDKAKTRRETADGQVSLLERLVRGASQFQFVPDERGPYGASLNPDYERILIRMIELGDPARMQGERLGDYLYERLGPQGHRVMAALLETGYDMAGLLETVVVKTLDPPKSPSSSRDPAITAFGWMDAHMDLLRVLLRFGADPNAVVGRGSSSNGQRTLLTEAVYWLHVPLVQLLVQYGAQLYFPADSNTGFTNDVLRLVVLYGSRDDPQHRGGGKVFREGAERPAVAEMFRVLKSQVNLRFEGKYLQSLRCAIAHYENSLRRIPPARMDKRREARRQWLDKGERIGRKEQLRQEIIVRLAQIPITGRNLLLERRGTLFPLEEDIPDLMEKIRGLVEIQNEADGWARERGEPPAAYDRTSPRTMELFSQVEGQVRRKPFVGAIATGLTQEEAFDSRYVSVPFELRPYWGRFCPTAGCSLFLQYMLTSAGDFSIGRINDKHRHFHQQYLDLLELLIDNCDPYELETLVRGNSGYVRNMSKEDYVPVFWWLVLQQFNTRISLLPLLKRVLERGVNPDVQDSHGNTLATAFFYERYARPLPFEGKTEQEHAKKCIRLLLKYGASPNHRARENAVLLTVQSTIAPAYDFGEDLLKYGADPDIAYSNDMDVPLACFLGPVGAQDGYRRNPRAYLPPVTGRSHGFAGAALVQLNFNLDQRHFHTDTEVRDLAVRALVRHEQLAHEAGKPAVHWDLLPAIVYPGYWDKTLGAADRMLMHSSYREPRLLRMLLDSNNEGQYTELILVLIRCGLRPTEAELEDLFKKEFMRQYIGMRDLEAMFDPAVTARFVWSQLPREVVMSMAVSGTPERSRWAVDRFVPTITQGMFNGNDQLPAKTVIGYLSSWIMQASVPIKARGVDSTMAANLAYLIDRMLGEYLRRYNRPHDSGQSSHTIGDEGDEQRLVLTMEPAQVAQAQLNSLRIQVVDAIERQDALFAALLAYYRRTEPDLMSALITPDRYLTFTLLSLDKLNEIAINDNRHSARNIGLAALFAKYGTFSERELLDHARLLAVDDFPVAQPEAAAHLPEIERLWRSQLALALYSMELSPRAGFDLVRGWVNILGVLQHPEVPLNVPTMHGPDEMGSLREARALMRGGDRAGAFAWLMGDPRTVNIVQYVFERVDVMPDQAPKMLLQHGSIRVDRGDPDHPEWRNLFDCVLVEPGHDDDLAAPEQDNDDTFRSVGRKVVQTLRLLTGYPHAFAHSRAGRTILRDYEQRKAEWERPEVEDEETEQLQQLADSHDVGQHTRRQARSRLERRLQRNTMWAVNQIRQDQEYMLRGAVESFCEGLHAPNMGVNTLIDMFFEMLAEHLRLVKSVPSNRDFNLFHSKEDQKDADFIASAPKIAKPQHIANDPFYKDVGTGYRGSALPYVNPQSERYERAQRELEEELERQRLRAEEHDLELARAKREFDKDSM